MRLATFLLGAALALALALATGTGARAQTPPEGLVWIALNDLNRLRVDADDPTNHPPLAIRPPPGMIVAVDLSPDGRPDWLVDYEAAGEAGYCGTGGCRKRLYVSYGDGYVRAFDAVALDLAVVEAGGERRLDVQVHSLWCADERADCRYSYAWEAGRLAVRDAPAEPAAEDERFSPLSLARE